ncbi:hypothetical protein KQI88_12550 [Alkaliphilus sp. MSJ-5]|uniref:Toxin ETX/toxin MTX2 n=1 Tax=Alkaliphilus flagellatus TaxID=2841507 RepID=A0ABS6G430_9FIRM|nr:hypothetical protein [Alkaliphilus flagellatus]MBU5677244.1 hypothetical protein [Alkaliphilus flagellatus]
MKLFKRFVTKLSICALMVGMFISPTFAHPSSIDNIESFTTLEATVDISNIPLGQEVVLPDGAVLTPISEEEYMTRLAKDKNISLKEAYEMELKNLSSLRSSGNTFRYNYSKTFTYSRNSSFKADLEATLSIYTGGSFRQINEVLGVGTRRRSGLYDFDFIETYSYSDPLQGSSKFPVGTVHLGANGYFEVVVSGSVGGSIEVPGFTFEASVGQDAIWLSRTMSMDGSYSVY